LIEKILTLARECLRDNLTKKLINLWSLSLETSYKPSKLREEVHKKMKSYLSNSENIKRYKERLQKKEINDFYNLSDIDFRNLLKEKNGIIKKCQEYEERAETKEIYEATESLRYIIDEIPIST
jgi:beta-N-acetylglucosaminidase